MPQNYDVIVAGVGSMGSAACYHLAKAGARVLGLDGQNIPNNNSSYNGGTRVIRLSYFEHPDYVPLLREAYRYWREVEEETGVKVFHQTGILYLGRPEGHAISGVIKASRQHNLPCSSLTREDVREQHPQFNVPESHVGLFEEAGGYILAEQAVATYATGAIQRGATLRSNEAVTDWKCLEGSVEVTTPLDTYRARHLVLTAGAWSSRLLPLPRLDLTVTRQVLGWVWPRKPALFAPGRFPCWNIDPAEDGSMQGVYYGFPLSTGISEGVGLKFARHYPGEEMDPDKITAETTVADREQILGGLRRYLPDATGDLLALKVCRYTNTIDGHFVIDRHPGAENVHFACGFSGHGFKFSSVMGKVLADLALEGTTVHPIGFLGLGRFR